ncbi:MAG: DUF2721 domain-containing protein [Planctomycetota bacterium]
MTTHLLAATDWAHLPAAAVVPVVVISAASLMSLAFYNRLGLIIGRLRQISRERLQLQDALLAHMPADAGHTVRLSRSRKESLLGELAVQSKQLARRARLIRGTLTCLLLTIAMMVLVSLLLGVADAVGWAPGGVLAAALFVAGQLSMLAAVGFALAELMHGLLPIEMELEFVTNLDEERHEDAESTGGRGGIG